ncbi:MAG TPA: 4a-hydroxytetrahydrobiopterin dehydratase [Nitrospiria bacterium]|nr:4a-hydroxytetrahydrobiopterin dehydratase [Nitrospiria bacterium]
MALLSMEDVRRKIHALKGWELVDSFLQRRYTFRSFKQAMSFVNSVANLAEAQDHHPDIIINYNRVTLKLSTHIQGGITDKDFNLARLIDTQLRLND